MPRLGHMIVDGLALVFVGAGLIAVVVGYERNLPAPAARVVEFVSDWSDPATTGSIDPAPVQTRWSDEAKSRPSESITRAWTDPQYR